MNTSKLVIDFTFQIISPYLVVRFNVESSPAYFLKISDDELGKAVLADVVAVYTQVAAELGGADGLYLPETDMEFLVGEEVFEVDRCSGEMDFCLGQELVYGVEGLFDGLVGFEEG